MKRKKLLYVGNALSHSGKTVTHIESLSTLLRQEGHTVEVTSSKVNKALRLTDMVRSFFKHKKDTDIVLIDTYSTSNFWYAVVIGNLCRTYNIPYIPILHGGNLPSRLSKNKLSCEKLCGKALVNVAPSGYLYNAFAKAGLDNLKLIPNHIHITAYPYKRRSAIAPNLLWVRSFAEIYNPLMALEVLESLLPNYPDAQLTMVGPEKDGSLEKCLLYAQNNDLPVTFTGKLSKSEWTERSKDFDVFINTTNFDNTPVSIIEAMALGLPIISTDVGGIPHLIDAGEDGLLVAPGDAQSFAESIDRLLTDRTLVERLTLNARTKVTRFDWDIVKTSWSKLLS